MLKKLVKFFIVTNYFLIFSSVVHTQSIVHAENKRLEGDKEGFSGNIQLGLNFVQNINDVLQSQNASQFQYVHKKHNFISVNALNLTIFNESRIINDGFQHFRYGYKFSNRLTWEAFVQAQYNEIIKIRGRYLTGTGPRFKILDTKEDSIKVYFGVMYMPEYEEETTDIINRHHRVSNMLSFGWPISDKIEIDLISYYQPDLARVSDFRVSSEFRISIQLIERLSFNYSMAWFYDSYPPEGIRNVFYNIRNTLRFDL